MIWLPDTLHAAMNLWWMAGLLVSSACPFATPSVSWRMSAAGRAESASLAMLMFCARGQWRNESWQSNRWWQQIGFEWGKARWKKFLASHLLCSRSLRLKKSCCPSHVASEVRSWKRGCRHVWPLWTHHPWMSQSKVLCLLWLDLFATQCPKAASRSKTSS